MHKAAAGFALSVAYFAAPRGQSVCLCVWQYKSVAVVVAAGWKISKQMHIMFRIREKERKEEGGSTA